MKVTVLAYLFVGAALLLACDTPLFCEDCCDSCPPPPPPPSFKPPTTAAAVLNNLELSYNKRNLTRFDEVLDSDFTFYFWPGDVGGSIPEQWGRAEEIAVTTLLFDPTLSDPRYPTCRSIRMNLDFENGLEWVEVVPEDFPDQTWYKATVPYDFTFEMKPDIIFIARGPSAEFTVRNVGTVDEPRWDLVEWRDLGSNSILAASLAS